MAQKAALTAEEFKALPDTIAIKKAEAYVERDGSYVLDVEQVGGIALQDISGLKSAADKQRREIEKMKAANAEALARLEELKDLAENPAAARNALEMIKNPDRATAERLKILEDELRTKAENQIKKIRDEELAKNVALTKQLEDEKLARMNSHHDALVARVISEAEMKSKIARPFVEKLLKTVRQEDGKLISYVVDEHGEPIMGKGVLSTQYADPVDFVKALKSSADHAPLFEATKAGGSGARTVENGRARGAGIDPAGLRGMSYADYEARRNAGEPIAGT